MLTNKGLVEHSKKALAEKWGYVWGTFGEILTPRLLNEKIMQYPREVGGYKDFITAKWLNKRTADCVGLIKSYVWWNGNNPYYKPVTDVSADGMFSRATEKGTINSLPIRDLPGLCLWKEGHIGVYIGNGQVIESHGTKFGVIQTPLKGNGSSPWTHWLKCPFITYEEEIPVKETYIEIINNVSNGSADRWIKGIDAAKAAAKASGDLGALEIFEFLPELIEGIVEKYKRLDVSQK